MNENLTHETNFVERARPITHFNEQTAVQTLQISRDNILIVEKNIEHKNHRKE